MLKSTLNKIKSSFFVIAPITLVVFLLCIFVVPTSAIEKINLGICFALLILGLSFFESGANSSMSVIGETIGSGLCRTKKLWLIIISSFVIGFIITFAEPDLQVFAKQASEAFPSIKSEWIVIITISTNPKLTSMFWINFFITK